MALITMIFSGLALLAAIMCLFLTVQEKKRNQKRNAAALSYVDETVETVKSETVAYVAQFAKDFDSRMKRLDEGMERLEKGIVPDYEQALAAANAVNDFNRGISNILGYDPSEALKAQREKERQGEA